MSVLCSVLLSHLAIKWMDVRVSGNQFLFRLEGCCKCKHTKWNFWIPIQNNQALSLKVKYCDWAQLISGLVTIYLKDDSDFFLHLVDNLTLKKFWVVIIINDEESCPHCKRPPSFWALPQIAKQNCSYKYIYLLR